MNKGHDKDVILKPGVHYVDGVYVRLYEPVRLSRVKSMVKAIKSIERKHGKKH